MFRRSAFILAAFLTADLSHGQTTDSPTDAEDIRQSLVAEYQSRLREINRARIVGGEPATEGQLPWQVALVSAGYLPKDGQFCGGSLIAQRWVLTAAHCVAAGTTSSDLMVFLDSIDLKDRGRSVGVRQIYPHPQYNAKTFDNDVALLLLEEAGSTGSVIDPLPPEAEAESLANGRKGRTSGWGKTTEGGASSKVLRWVDVPFVTKAICNGAESYKGRITDNMICAGREEGGADSCQGDSGGPLATPEGAGWRLAGVVSWGDGCGRPKKYGIYSRVSRYGAWIRSHISEPVETVASRARADWMTHVDWAIANTDAGGSTDCPGEYQIPGCILSGGRACLMREAVGAARNGRCADAFRFVSVTQCHNPTARAELIQAGEKAVCDYLKTK
jgi:hypothetical protein